MRPIPEKFIERINVDLGEEQAAALCQALDGESPTSIRFNPYKIGKKPQGCGVPWNKYGMYLDQRPQFTFDTDFHAGVYYVQEAGSQFVGHLLEGMNMEGKRVLDMCASPGGKTTLYSSLVGLDGLVLANEIDKRRANILADNVRRWGLGNVVVSSNPPKHIANFKCWFDVVAVDAPCSGEGMFRKSDEAREEWNESNVKMCATRQGEILREAWQSLRAGGVLIYSTCTFNKLENEGVLEEFSAFAEDEVAAYDDVAVEDSWGVEKGSVGAFQTFRFYPHRSCSEGFFVAIARKAFDTNGSQRTPKCRKPIFENVDRIGMNELPRWIKQPELMHFAMVGDMCYGYYLEQFDAVKNLAEYLTVIYSGVSVGQVFKGKLKPDAALATFCGVNEEALPCVELSEADAIKYLSKQDVDVSLFSEGLNLVKCGGSRLGFIKRIGNRANNMYPNSLRIFSSK